MEEATQSNPVKSEGSLLLQRLFVVQTSQKRQHPQEQVGGTIPGFRTGSMVAVVETKQTMCGIWFCGTETAGATHHDRIWTDVQCALKVWSMWESCQQGDKHWKGLASYQRTVGLWMHSRIHSGDCLNLVSRSRDLSWTLFLTCRSTSTRESLYLMCALRGRCQTFWHDRRTCLGQWERCHLLFSMAEPSVTDALRLLPLLRFAVVFDGFWCFIAVCAATVAAFAAFFC